MSTGVISGREQGRKNANQRTSVVIYTHSLLEGSMTFIKSQAEALVRYLPVYVGAHRAGQLPLPPDRTYVLNEHTPIGVVREALFRRWGWAPSLFEKIGAHDPKIVHVHFGNCGPAGMFIARSLGVPLLVTFHGQDATMHAAEAAKTFRGRELLRKKTQLIDRAAGFVAVSDYIRHKMVENGYPEDKIVVHRNGIDLAFFRPPDEGAREPIVVFVGRFVEKKGARYLLEAAGRLQRAGTSFELVMIGGGPLEHSLKRFAELGGVRCHFPGFVPVQQVREWLGRASVVAVPSVTAADGDSEGLPTVLLEAQAMATPVVATYHSGTPEGVMEGVTAELVRERDVEGLADKLAFFLKSPAVARAYGLAGRGFVAENFDMRVQVSGLEDIYDKLRGGAIG